MSIFLSFKTRRLSRSSTRADFVSLLFVYPAHLNTNYRHFLLFVTEVSHRCLPSSRTASIFAPNLTPLSSRSLRCSSNSSTRRSFSPWPSSTMLSSPRVPTCSRSSLARPSSVRPSLSFFPFASCRRQLWTREGRFVGIAYSWSRLCFFSRRFLSSLSLFALCFVPLFRFVFSSLRFVLPF